MHTRAANLRSEIDATLERLLKIGVAPNDACEAAITICPVAGGRIEQHLV